VVHLLETLQNVSIIWREICIIIIISISIITYLFSAIEFSLGGSSPYISTDKTNKNKYT